MNALDRLTEEIVASEGHIAQSKSQADVRFHRARIRRLTSKARRLERCIRILERELKAELIKQEQSIESLVNLYDDFIRDHFNH